MTFGNDFFVNGDFWGDLVAQDSPCIYPVLGSSANAQSYINNGQSPGMSADQINASKFLIQMILSLATVALKLICEHNWWHHFHYDIFMPLGYFIV